MRLISGLSFLSFYNKKKLLSMFIFSNNRPVFYERSVQLSGRFDKFCTLRYSCVGYPTFAFVEG